MGFDLYEKGVPVPEDLQEKWNDQYKRPKPPLQLAVVIQDHCTGCDACVQAQPAFDPRTGITYMDTNRAHGYFPQIGCLVSLPSHESDPNGEGMRIVEIDFNQCIGCKACEKVCPWDAIHVMKVNNQEDFDVEDLAQYGTNRSRDPWYFSGRLDVFYEGTTTVQEIRWHNKKLDYTELFQVEENSELVKFKLNEKGEIIPSSKSKHILHPPIKEIFSGQWVDEVAMRYPAYEIIAHGWYKEFAAPQGCAPVII